jgi:hypothetical protein
MYVVYIRFRPTLLTYSASLSCCRCEAKLAQSAKDLAQGIPPSHRDSKLAWCKDFLVADEQGLNTGGSCCFKDEQRAAWCGQVGIYMYNIALKMRLIYSCCSDGRGLWLRDERCSVGR